MDMDNPAVRPGLAVNPSMALIVVGLGLLWSWMTIAFYSPIPFALSDDPAQPAQIANNTVFLTCAALNFAIAFLSLRRTWRLAVCTEYLVGFGVMGSAALLLMWLLPNNMAMVVVAGLLAGVANFVLFYSACTKLAVHGSFQASIAAIFAGSTLVSALITLVALLVGPIGSAVFGVALPLAASLPIAFAKPSGRFAHTGQTDAPEDWLPSKEREAGITARDLLPAQRSEQEDDDQREPLAERVERVEHSTARPAQAASSTGSARPRIPWKLILGLSLYCFVFGLLGSPSETGGLEASLSGIYIHVFARGAAAATALVLVSCLKLNYGHLSTIGLICFVVGLAAYLAPLSQTGLLPSFFFTFGYTCIELLVFCILYDFYHETLIGWNTSIGLIKGTSLLARDLGAIIALFWNRDMGGGAWYVMMLALISVLVLVSANVFGIDDIAAFWNQPRRKGLIDLRNSGDVAREALATFGLSPRETEVALLLLEGRSEPFISEALLISGHTTHSHVNKIYRKMDVHSRQEFLDMVEKTWADMGKQ